MKFGILRSLLIVVFLFILEVVHSIQDVQCACGYFLNANLCVPCVPGTYSSTPGSIGCSLCPYGLVSGSASCECFEPPTPSPTMKPQPSPRPSPLPTTEPPSPHPTSYSTAHPSLELRPTAKPTLSKPSYQPSTKPTPAPSTLTPTSSPSTGTSDKKC